MELARTSPPPSKDEALTSSEFAPQLSPLSAGMDPVDRLMQVATGGSGLYSSVFSLIVVVSLHALLAFGTLSGVLLNPSIIPSLGLTPEQAALGNSLVFFGWIPGALVGGPVGDQLGRKAGLSLFALIGSIGILGSGLVPADAAWLFFLARAATGVGIGGFVAPCFALLVESNDPTRRGLSSVTWTWGYVAGVVILCMLHYATSELLGLGWRAEELTLGAWGLLFTAATQLLVTESPGYLLASGKTLEGLQAARTIARWNQVDLDAAISADPMLRSLRDAASACAFEVESEWRREDGMMKPMSDGMSNQEKMIAIREDEMMRISAAEVCAEPAEPEVSWSDLFGEDRLILTLTFGCMEVAYNMAFYVIVFSAGAISDQVLLNLVLLAAADLPGSTASGLLSDAIGPKRAALVFLSAASCVLLTLVAYQQELLPSISGVASPQLVTAGLSLMGKSMCSGAFTAIFLLFSECYPTKLRSAALGSGMMFGKLGAAAASPLITAFSLTSSLTISGGLLFAAAVGASTLPASKVTTRQD